MIRTRKSYYIQRFKNILAHPYEGELYVRVPNKPIDKKDRLFKRLRGRIKK